MPPRARRRRARDKPHFECVATLRAVGAGMKIFGVAVTPDGRIIIGCSDNTIKVLGSDNTLMTLTGHAGDVYTVLVLSDERVVSGSRDTTLRDWDLGSGRCVRVLTGHKCPITCLATLPGGRLFSASHDMPAYSSDQKIWDLATGRCLKTLDFRATQDLAVLPNGLVVAATLSSLAVWDLDRDGVEECWLYSTPEARPWAPDADPSTLEGHSSLVLSVVVLPDGRVLSGSGDSTLKLWDLPVDPNDLVICPYDEENDYWPDFDLEVHNYIDGTILRRCLQTIEGHGGSVNCVTAAPGGCFVSASDDHTLITWNASTGRPIQRLAGHSDGVLFVTVMPDGRLLSASRDGELKLWVDLTRDEAKKMALQIARQRACPDVAKTIAAFL